MLLSSLPVIGGFAVSESAKSQYLVNVIIYAKQVEKANNL